MEGFRGRPNFIGIVIVLLLCGAVSAQKAPVTSWSWNAWRCNANWDQTCQGEEWFTVAEGYRFCGYRIREVSKTPERAFWRVTSTNAQGVRVQIYATGSGEFWNQERGWVEIDVALQGVPSSTSDAVVRETCGEQALGELVFNARTGTDTECRVAVLTCRDYTIELGEKRYLGGEYLCGVCFGLGF